MRLFVILAGDPDCCVTTWATTWHDEETCSNDKRMDPYCTGVAANQAPSAKLQRHIDLPSLALDLHALEVTLVLAIRDPPVNCTTFLANCTTTLGASARFLLVNRIQKVSIKAPPLCNPGWGIWYLWSSRFWVYLGVYWPRSSRWLDYMFLTCFWPVFDIFVWEKRVQVEGIRVEGRCSCLEEK